MAKDYKHRVPGNRSRKPRKPDQTLMWAGVAAAVVTVLLGAWLFFSGQDEAQESPADPVTMTQMAAPPIKPADTPKALGKDSKSKVEVKIPADAPPAALQSSARKASPSPQAQPPRFTFYVDLLNQEVQIPESEIKNIKREESLGHKPAGTPYLLQAGSFNNTQEAEKLKAQLSKLQVKSRVETVSLNDGTWHRVIIGPFASVDEADRVRGYLRVNHVDSVIQKPVKK